MSLLYEKCPVCTAHLMASPLVIGEYYCGSCQEEWTWQEVQENAQTQMVWLNDGQSMFTAVVPIRKLGSDGVTSYRTIKCSWFPFETRTG